MWVIAKYVVFLLAVASLQLAFADQPVVGKKAAQKYFQKSSSSSEGSSSYGENVLMLHFGT